MGYYPRVHPGVQQQEPEPAGTASATRHRALLLFHSIRVLRFGVGRNLCKSRGVVSHLEAQTALRSHIQFPFEQRYQRHREVRRRRAHFAVRAAGAELDAGGAPLLLFAHAAGTCSNNLR